MQNEGGGGQNTTRGCVLADSTSAASSVRVAGSRPPWQDRLDLGSHVRISHSIVSVDPWLAYSHPVVPSPVQPACVHSPNLDPHMRTFASLAVPMPGARAGNRDVRSQVSIHAANPHTSSLYTSNAWSCDLRPPESPVVQPRRTSYSCDDSVIQGSQLSYLVISKRVAVICLATRRQERALRRPTC